MPTPLKYPGLEAFPAERNDPDLASLPAEEQLEHKQFLSVMDWCHAVGQENGIVNTIWSMYEIRDFSAVAYEGEWTVFYDGGWGTAGDEKIHNPTWLILWQIADRLIGQSGDRHHVFVEGYNIKDTNVLDISTGS